MSNTAAIAVLPAANGTARRVRWKPLLALAVVALLTAAYWPSADESQIAEAAPRQGAAAHSSPRNAVATVSAQLAFPVRGVRAPRADLFGSHSWRPAPPPEPPVQALPPPAPVAPPFPFAFFGKYEQAGGTLVLLFSRADRVYDVHLGDVLDNTWSVDEVAQGKVQVTYLPLNTSQSLTLGSSQ
jgi:hypothetical protein